MNSVSLFELAKNLQVASDKRPYVFKECIQFNRKDCIGEFIKDSSSILLGTDHC